MEYTQEKMIIFLEQDALIRFTVKDLIARGHVENYALRIAFNSLVLNDSEMEEIYNNL